MNDPLANIEMEAAFLGALLFDNPAIEQVADRVQMDDFSEPVHARIFDIITREHARGKVCTPVTLKGYFEGDKALDVLGGWRYLSDLTGNSASMIIPVIETADDIAMLARRRRMRAGLSTASNACADLESPIAEIVAFADSAISHDAESTIHQPTAAQCLNTLVDGFGKETKGVTCGVIPDIDQTLGQLHPKSFTVIAARPGMGKTAFALSYSIGAARQGHGTLFVSLEMSALDLSARMAADLCFDGREGVFYDAIRDNRLNDWQQRRVARAASEMAPVPFQIIDAGSLTVGRLNALVRRHARRMAANGHKLDLVVVDYIQLLRPDRRINKYEDISEVSMALKSIAKDNNVAVMGLAQLSRSVETRTEKTPQLSDLRDSGQIEQDADAVMFLLRQEYYISQAEPPKNDPKHLEWENKLAEWRGIIEFIVAKRRNGISGRTEGRFFGAYQAVRGQ